MSRSMFGWSYPPGAANDPLAPYNQGDPPCEVCGKFVDECICPECPHCGIQGDPDCYKLHGMTRSDTQVESLRAVEAEAQRTQDAAACTCSGAETGCEHSYWCPQSSED